MVFRGVIVQFHDCCREGKPDSQDFRSPKAPSWLTSQSLNCLQMSATCSGMWRYVEEDAKTSTTMVQDFTLHNQINHIFKGLGKLGIFYASLSWKARDILCFIVFCVVRRPWSAVSETSAGLGLRFGRSLQFGRPKHCAARCAWMARGFVENPATPWKRSTWNNKHIRL